MLVTDQMLGEVTAGKVFPNEVRKHVHKNMLALPIRKLD